MRHHKICIVGLGQSFSYQDSYIYRNFKDCDYHFVDTDRSRLPELKGKLKDCDATISLPNSQFDLAVICTPNGTHRRIAEHFINLDTPVFIDKPPALSGEDIEWLEEAEVAGAWITVGFQARFSAGLMTIRQFVDEQNPILFHINSWKHRSRDSSYYDDEWHGRWLTDGGVICQQGIHCVDAICCLTKESPEWVSMIGANYRHNIECEDTASMFIKFPGFTATVNSTTAMYKGGKAGSEIVCDFGVIRAEGFAWNKITNWGVYEPRPEITGGGGAYDTMWYEIRKALDTNGPPPIPVIDASRSMRIVHAGYCSWKDRNGEPVPYGQWFDKLGK